MSRLLLTTKGPTYYSSRDESAFFGWLLDISCVAEVAGELRSLHIRFKRQPSDKDLRELIALFLRYRMDMRSLSIFRTAKNAGWFANDSKAFWHAKVFGKSRQTARIEIAVK